MTGTLGAAAALATVASGLVAVLDHFGKPDAGQAGAGQSSGVVQAGGASPSGASGAAAAGSAGPELAYVVKLPTVADECGADWLVPESALGASGVVGENAPTGSAVMSGSSISVLVQVTTDRTLVLNSVHAKPVSGASVGVGYRAPGPACGGQVFKSFLKLDLDRPGQKAKPVPNPTATDRSVKEFPFTVAENDPIEFSIELDTVKDQVAFTLELEYTWGDQPGRLTIDNDHRPFFAGAGTGLPLACPDLSGTGALVAAPTGQQECVA